ncbi:hypothetical protein D9M71_163780 [compost metagenome]
MRSRPRSSRCSFNPSICRPVDVQWASSCKSLNCEVPSSSRLPIRTSANSTAKGSFRSGSCSGPLSTSSAAGANCSTIFSTCNCSMHKVRRNRHPGDQAKAGADNSTRSSPACQSRWVACHCPPRWPSKPCTSSPGTCNNAQRLPAWVPSSTPTAIITHNKRPVSPSNSPLITRFTVPAPWRSANGYRPDRPAHGPGQDGSGQPETPSARRYRHRS